MPTDIFPNINIPVITVVWTYNGLPPDDMSGRIVYYFERGLGAQVNDIEHMESQSLPSYGVVKVFFQKTRRHQRRAGPGECGRHHGPQTTAGGRHAAQTYSCSTPRASPILQLALSGHGLSQSQLFDYGQNFIRPQLATVAGAAIPSPYGGKVRQIQIDIDQNELRSYGLSAQDIGNTLATQNLITPVGTEKIGRFRVHRVAERPRRPRSPC